MISRFSRLPESLAAKVRMARFGGGEIPVLLAHPDWRTPRPVVVWFHGRTAKKELDPGRYIRWLKAGVAACAVDLPGHGERAEADLQTAGATLRVVERGVAEVDAVVSGLGEREWGGVFDTRRAGIGGMSAGGMIALRRLCDPHSFTCAAVEATAGSLSHMPGYARRHAGELLERVDPARHVGGWRPIPLLALHSEADEWAPVEAMRAFIERLRGHYESLGASAEMVRIVTWPSTGAPHEHLGFGRFSNDAKSAQAEFFAAYLGAGGRARGGTPRAGTEQKRADT